MLGQAALFFRVKMSSPYSLGQTVTNAERAWMIRADGTCLYLFAYCPFNAYLNARRTGSGFWLDQATAIHKILPEFT